jgi:hypothetical protein
VVSDQPWKDYFFIHPTRAARLPDGVFKARMAAWMKSVVRQTSAP